MDTDRGVAGGWQRLAREPGPCRHSAICQQPFYSALISQYYQIFYTTLPSYLLSDCPKPNLGFGAIDW